MLCGARDCACRSRRDCPRRLCRQWLGKLISKKLSPIPPLANGGGIFLFQRRSQRSGLVNSTNTKTNNTTMNTIENHPFITTPNTILAQLFYAYMDAGLEQQTALEAAYADYACEIEREPHGCPSFAL